MSSDEPILDDRPVYVTEIEIHQDKLLGKKWRRLVGMVHSESRLGKARLDLFLSTEKAKDGLPFRTILLTECVSMRASTTDHRETIRVQLKDDSSIDISCKKLDELTKVLSKIAFPRKTITLKNTPLESPSSEDELIICNEYPVLLLPSTLNRNSKLAEGNYSLEFAESLLLKNGSTAVQAYPFSNLLWVAAGENCIGFEVEAMGIFEFICASPLSVVESFRGHIRFSCIFTPLTVKTTNKYNRCYYPNRSTPMDTPETSNNSTLESKVSENMYNLSESMSDCSFTPSLLETSATSDVPSVLSTSMEKDKKKSKIFSLFRRNSKKKQDGAGRSAFEENADGEWLRMEKDADEKRSRSDALPELSAETFKLELEKSIAENKKRRELSSLNESIAEE